MCVTSDEVVPYSFPLTCIGPLLCVGHCAKSKAPLQEGEADTPGALSVTVLLHVPGGMTNSVTHVTGGAT